jgi:CubicO group peptidase (beta-lactamase class C family)
MRSRYSHLASPAVGIVSASFLITAAASAAPASKPPASIARPARAFLKSTGTPGIAVTIDDNGSTNIYCFGQARSDTPGKIQPDTVFGIGSVTKTFTGPCWPRK